MTNFKAQMSNQAQNLKSKYLSFGLWILFVVWILSFGFFDASAQQSPELLLGWKAGNSAPPDYTGKVLPVNGTRVAVGLDLLENNRLVDLASYTIRWYVDDALKQSGRGLRNFSFVADALGGDDEIQAVVVGYRGDDVSKTITIPIVDPELVIDAPYPGGLIGAGANPVKALLYFFDISGLDQINLTWSANGAVGEENASNILSLDTEGLPSGTGVKVEAQAQNIRQILERASASISLKIR